MSNDTRRARLGDALVERCESIPQERIVTRLLGLVSWDWYVSSGWQDRTAGLYAVAAKVAKRVNNE